MDTLLMVGRDGLGGLLSAHGAQKLFGWFGGYGVAGTGAFFEQYGLRPGARVTAAAGVTELAGGPPVALGVLGAIGAAIILSVMIVAIVAVHLHNGLLANSNGVELPLLYGIGAVLVAATGYGPYSLDSLLGL